MSEKNVAKLLIAIDRVITNHGLATESLWRHYKGDVYEVKGVSVDGTTSEVVINYRKKFSPSDRLDECGYNRPFLAADVTFTRKLSEWIEEIDGTPRFVKVRAVTCYMNESEYRMHLQQSIKD